MDNSKMNIKFALFLSLVVLMGACKVKKEAVSPTVEIAKVATVATPPLPPDIEEEEEDAPLWAPKKFAYKASDTRRHDLLHTKLDVLPVWEKSQLEGKAWLTLKPHFYPSQVLELDAKGFLIQKISMVEGKEMRELKFSYDDQVLKIDLGREYTRKEEYKVYIEYTARPEELEAGGSLAITSDKGLYFINPKGEIKDKPTQLWTQGETEASSCWFPTIDSPNERCTQELTITVEDRFKTLSNGDMVSTVKNSDGTRSDTWKMDKPHAPYLFMMGVGEFAVVKDEWRGKEVSYYVEPQYEAYARDIFPKTPQMIEYFSKTLGVDFPWAKYSQIAVQDFVSGAMENTTAVTFYPQVQQSSREALDNSQHGIVAHELFHHWFGDLVTCESWANLPLNESFATYGESLWEEHEDGRDGLMFDVATKRTSYLRESQSKREPLIRFQHQFRDDMFDGHSYSKGGVVLNNLRHVVGDEAFFASLKKYLDDNAYTAVEIHDLRLAFEAVTGEDLNWFFNQWFLSPGHPELTVTYGWEDGKATIEVQQTQDQRYMPIYRLPVKIDIFANGKHRIEEVVFRSEDTTFVFEQSTQPEYMLFDSDRYLLATYRENHKQDESISILKNGSNWAQKYVGLYDLRYNASEDKVRDAIIEACEYPFWGLRRSAMEALEIAGSGDEEIIIQVARKYANDKNPLIRQKAQKLLQSQIESLTKQAELYKMSEEVAKMLDAGLRDQSYSVQAAALKTLSLVSTQDALESAQKLEKDSKGNLVLAISRLYINEKSPRALEYTGSQIISTGGGFSKFGLVNQFAEYCKSLEDGPEKDKAIDYLMRFCESSNSWFMKFAALNTLNEFLDRENVRAFYEKRAEVETNERLRDYYKKQLEGE